MLNNNVSNSQNLDFGTATILSYLSQHQIKSSKQYDYGKSNVIRKKAGERAAYRKN